VTGLRDSLVDLPNREVFGMGTVAHGATIPLPYYKDGTRATTAQVCGVLVSTNAQDWYNHQYDGFSYHQTCSVDANLLVTCRVIGDGHGTTTGVANYLIICRR